MWVNLKKNICDIYVYVVFYHFRTTWMLYNKIAQIQDFILVENIFLVILFRLDDPFLDGLFLHGTKYKINLIEKNLNL